MITRFIPAVSRYPGFCEVWLSRVRDDRQSLELDVIFDTEEQRLVWVDSQDHAVAWAPLRECCNEVTIARFEVLIRSTADAVISDRDDPS
jgi:heme-degrading monooxygenase HmoA